MNTLLLMRHCHADAVGAVAGDRHRPLSPAGRAEADQVADWLRQTSRLPDGLLCSAALRTRQTADAIVAAVPDVRRHDVAEFYNADDAGLIAGIADRAVRHDLLTTNTLLVLGHNPTISDAIGVLTRRPVMLPPGGVVVIEVGCDWSQPLRSNHCRWVDQWSPGLADL